MVTDCELSLSCLPLPLFILLHPPWKTTPTTSTPHIASPAIVLKQIPNSESEPKRKVSLHFLPQTLTTLVLTQCPSTRINGRSTRVLVKQSQHRRGHGWTSPHENTWQIRNLIIFNNSGVVLTTIWSKLKSFTKRYYFIIFCNAKKDSKIESKCVRSNCFT